MRLIFLFFFFICTKLFAQDAHRQEKNYSISSVGVAKPMLDDQALQNWQDLSVGEPVASGDGKYFAYKVDQRGNLPRLVILQAIEEDWKFTIGSVNLIGFSKDSRFCLYKVGDTLCLYALKERRLFRSIAGIKNYQFPAREIPLSWLQSKDHDYVWTAWQLKSGNELYLYNLMTQKERRYPDVSSYLFDRQGTVLVLQKTNHDIEWIDLYSDHSTIVWSSKLDEKVQPGSIDIDPLGKQLAFVLQKKDNVQFENSIWLYRPGMKQPEQKANNQSSGIEPGLMISNSVSFNHDGRYINIFLQKPASLQPSRNDIKVDVWNYKDTILQSMQLYGRYRERLEQMEYAATIQVANDQVIQLTHKFGDRIKSLTTADYAIVSSNSSGDRFWLVQEDSNWLVSQKDGSKRLLNVNSDALFDFSPDDKFLLYYDTYKHHYYSFELATGKIVTLTGSLPPLTMAAQSQGDYSYPFEQPGKKLMMNWTMGIAGWIEGGKHVLVYDDYDIWQLHLSGQEAPINLTAGHGVTNKIRFRLAASEQLTNLPKNAPLLLVAFNRNNKENGFYQVRLGRQKKPELLTMGPYTYYHFPGSVYLSFNNDPGIPPVRIGNLNSWIVKRQSFRDAVNYYLTLDFKNFKTLTNYAPEKHYNWLQAELITWKRPDGDTNQGILYKPDNFDPQKKYPVIVNAYTRQSDGLYRYLEPGYSRCPLFDIPYIVSRDYLVFVPDLHYMFGAHGRSGLASVESGIQALARLSYVDTSKMALTGHSFSGQTAFYVAANSHLFKAVIAGAGWTDMISSYLQLSGPAGKAKTHSYMGFLESNFNNYNLWERPDLYQAESPVLQADKVGTPLLIFHNQADAKPFEQAVGMFLALRRLQKPAWMLQYDGASHIVGGKQAYDFTIRIMQFFDHYLKGLPAPRWMTRGIRASQKGIDDGYELDKDGKCGPHCTICNQP